MKISIKMVKTAALAALIVFLMAACGDVDSGGENNGPTHYDSPLIITNQQVWERNYDATSTKDEWYYRFTGDHDVSIYTASPIDLSNNKKDLTINPTPIGSGKIETGILEFNVAKPEQENLLTVDYLEIFFQEWDEVRIEPPETKGNNITPVISTEKEILILNREGLAGTHFSFGMESIEFIYVDNDCTITGIPAVKSWFYDDNRNYISHTEIPLNLTLKKGWNTVCRKEIFNDSGYDNVSMEIKNPNNFKWAIMHE